MLAKFVVVMLVCSIVVVHGVPPMDPRCESSGAADIIRSHQFITAENYTSSNFKDILDSIKRDNRREWLKMQTFEEYYYPEAYYEYENYGNFECKDVCRQRRTRVEGVIVPIETTNNIITPVINHHCVVVGNPNLFFTQCDGINSDRTGEVFASQSMQCIPDNVQYRDVHLYCPKAIPQCRTRRLELPQSCSLYEIKCKLSQFEQMFLNGPSNPLAFASFINFKK